MTGGSVAVLDIDGVLADVSHRLHHLATKPKNWDAFFAAASDDPPLAEGVDLARSLAAEHTLVYLTGRPSRLRRATDLWLRRHDLPPGHILMRRGGNFRPAHEVKLDLLRAVSAEHQVHVVVDDDAAVVRALRQAGFTVQHATWQTTSSAGGAALHQAQEREGRT